MTDYKLFITGLKVQVTGENKAHHLLITQMSNPVLVVSNRILCEQGF